MKMHEFNTRRKYSPDGQIIRWAIFSGPNEGDPVTYRVVFADITRGVQGTIMFWSMDKEPTDMDVLNAYDAGHYVHCNIDELPMRQALENYNKEEAL